MFDFSLIDIGETKYTLRFPLSAMIKAERAIGKPLQTMFSPRDMESAFDFKFEDLVTLFKIGMQAEHRDLKETDLESLLMQYLQQGDSMLAQEMQLYILIGKAMGFFRKLPDKPEGKEATK